MSPHFSPRNVLVRLIGFARAGYVLKITSHRHQIISVSARLLWFNSPTFRIVITILCRAYEHTFRYVKIIWMSLNDHPLWRDSFEVFFLMGGSLNIEIFLIS